MNDASVAGRWCGQRERPGTFLLAGFGFTAAAEAQVVGGIVDEALKRDDDAVHETSEGVDVSCIQALEDVVEQNGHHDEEQELEQKSEEASSDRGLLGGERAAPPGERLRVRAALAQDRALHSGLIQPVFVGFQRSACCTADGTSAGCTGQAGQQKAALFLSAYTQWPSSVNLV